MAINNGSDDYSFTDDEDFSSSDMDIMNSSDPFEQDVSQNHNFSHNDNPRQRSESQHTISATESAQPAPQKKSNSSAGLIFGVVIATVAITAGGFVGFPYAMQIITNDSAPVLSMKPEPRHLQLDHSRNAQDNNYYVEPYQSGTILEPVDRAVVEQAPRISFANADPKEAFSRSISDAVELSEPSIQETPEWNHQATTSKQILQLEAQLAMLSLELTEQKAKTAASMRASGEASRVVLTLRDGLSGMRSDLNSLKSLVNKSDKRIEEINKRISSMEKKNAETIELVKQEVDKARPSQVASSSSTVVVPSNPEPIANTKPEPEKPIESSGPRKMDVMNLVMVNDRAGYVHNLANNQRYVLQVGQRYEEFGRVTKIDQMPPKIYGVYDNGSKWVIDNVGQ